MIKGILGALKGGTGLLAGAGSAAALMGCAYLLDCRITARDPGAVQSCYTQAILMITTAAGTGAGFAAGYNTLNPALHQDDKRRGLLGLTRKL